MAEHKNEKKNIWSKFSSWDYVLNHHHAIGYHSCFYICSLVIATPGQKILHWQLRKVIPSDMYNCNFEAIN